MNEDYWYYEEKIRHGEWIDAYAGHRFSQKDDALRHMELRKRAFPRAVLRLVHYVKTRVSYAQRGRHER